MAELRNSSCYSRRHSTYNQSCGPNSAKIKAKASFTGIFFLTYVSLLNQLWGNIKSICSSSFHAYYLKWDGQAVLGYHFEGPKGPLCSFSHCLTIFISPLKACWINKWCKRFPLGELPGTLIFPSGNVIGIRWAPSFSSLPAPFPMTLTSLFL